MRQIEQKRTQRFTQISLLTLLLISICIPETIAAIRQQPFSETQELSGKTFKTTNSSSEPLLLTQAKKPRQGLLQRFKLRRRKKPAQKRVQRRKLWQRIRLRRQKPPKVQKKPQNRRFWQRIQFPRRKKSS